MSRRFVKKKRKKLSRIQQEARRRGGRGCSHSVRRATWWRRRRRRMHLPQTWTEIRKWDRERKHFIKLYFHNHHHHHHLVATTAAGRREEVDNTHRKPNRACLYNCVWIERPIVELFFLHCAYTHPERQKTQSYNWVGHSHTPACIMYHIIYTESLLWSHKRERYRLSIHVVRLLVRRYCTLPGLSVRLTCP